MIGALNRKEQIAGLASVISAHLLHDSVDAFNYDNGNNVQRNKRSNYIKTVEKDRIK